MCPTLQDSCAVKVRGRRKLLTYVHKLCWEWLLVTLAARQLGQGSLSLGTIQAAEALGEGMVYFQSPGRFVAFVFIYFIEFRAGTEKSPPVLPLGSD